MGNLAISINGGGALGIGPLWFMTRLEADLGKSLSGMSVAYSGTSTGAIIAACLSEGMSATAIYYLYSDNLKKIFTKYPWYKRINPSCPTYDNSNLKKMLKTKLTGKLNDWKKPVYITTTCMNGDSVEKVWGIGDTEEKWFAVLSSASAPTYFDVLEKDGKYYCDGGMWSNDPIMVLEAGIKRDNPEWKPRILSFNTTMDTPNDDTDGNRCLLKWGEYILDNWVARTGKSNTFEAMSNIGKENVFSVSPKVSHKYKMDNLSLTSEVTKIWDKEYDAVKKDLIPWIVG
jgi:hypothetical protein